MKLTIDCAQKTVMVQAPTGETRVFKKRWAELLAFLAFLALGEDSRGQYATAATIRGIGKWSTYRSALNVGKTVSSLLKILERTPFRELLQAKNKTDGWRLNLPPSDIEVQPSPHSLHDWLFSIGWRHLSYIAAGGLASETDWAVHIAKSLFALQAGRLAEAIDFAQKASTEATSPLHRSISDIILMRGWIRYGSSEEELSKAEDIHERIMTTQDEFWGDTIRARADALLAISSGPDEIEAQIERLSRSVQRLTDKGDSGSLGVIYNVLAVLARRKGDFERAEGFLRQAIPFLALANDLPNLHGALCNLADVLRREHKENLRSDIRGCL